MNVRTVFVFAVLFAVGVASSSHSAEGEKKWAKRCEDTLKAQCKAKDNSDTIAQSILTCTHPSGKNAKISDSTATNDGSIVTSVITITWNGGLTGAEYSTTITWKFDKAQHISAEVTSDNAVISVNAEHKKQLNDWFRDSMFPAYGGGK